MSAARDTALLERIARVLCMVGSAHDGEALNAARLADRMIRERGLTWHDALSPAANDRYLPERTPPWRHSIEECLRRPGSLRLWERGFLESITRFPRLSPKQRACLRQIAERVLGQVAA